MKATVEQQLTLLRLAARVDPHLRQAVDDVEVAMTEKSAETELLSAALGWLAVWFDKAPVEHFEWDDRIRDLILALPGVAGP